MGHLNSFSASGGGNLNTIFQKIQMPGEVPGGGGEMFKLRFDWYIILKQIHQVFKKSIRLGGHFLTPVLDNTI